LLCQPCVGCPSFGQKRPRVRLRGLRCTDHAKTAPCGAAGVKAVRYNETGRLDQRCGRRNLRHAGGGYGDYASGPVCGETVGGAERRCPLLWVPRTLEHLDFLACLGAICSQRNGHHHVCLCCKEPAPQRRDCVAVGCVPCCRFVDDPCRYCARRYYRQVSIPSRRPSLRDWEVRVAGAR